MLHGVLCIWRRRPEFRAREVAITSLQCTSARVFRLIVQVRHFAVSKSGGTYVSNFPKFPPPKSLRILLENQLIKNQEHGQRVRRSAGVCDPTLPTGGMKTSRRRAMSCSGMRTVGDGAAGRWVSLLCLLMCVATGEVLASQGTPTKGRAVSAAGA